MAPKLPSLGVDEIKNDPQGFGKALFAELLGTAILVSQPGSETSQFILYMFLEDRSHHNKADHVFASMNTFFFTKVFVGCGSCMGGDDSDSTTELGEHEGIIVWNSVPQFLWQTTEIEVMRFYFSSRYNQ